MKTDETICLNSKVNGKQPSLEHRIYNVGGGSTCDNDKLSLYDNGGGL